MAEILFSPPLEIRAPCGLQAYIIGLSNPLWMQYETLIAQGMKRGLLTRYGCKLDNLKDRFRYICMNSHGSMTFLFHTDPINPQGPKIPVSSCMLSAHGKSSPEFGISTKDDFAIGGLGINALCVAANFAHSHGIPEIFGIVERGNVPMERFMRNLAAHGINISTKSFQSEGGYDEHTMPLSDDNLRQLELYAHEKGIEHPDTSYANRLSDAQLANTVYYR